MANKEINLGSGHMVGLHHPPFFIAEIGINHNGDIQIAKKLIDGAFACNWSCVKFQKRTPDICVPEHQKNIMKDTPWGKMTYLEYKYRVEFGASEYDIIDAHCNLKPILWSASVWDVPSVEFLSKYNIPFLKIPSAKLTDKDLLHASISSGRPVILSTGMSTLEEIDEAVNILESKSNGDYIVMHSNSSYPAPHEDLNLAVIKTLRKRYDCIIGYSGHEFDLEPTIIAIAFGAKVIERHVTLDHNMWGSDHFASLEIHGMDLLKKRAKDVNAVIGDGVKRITPQELEVRNKLRGQ